ncbi:hypothetical protein PR048_020146 [Dryococelus australis]|uniref:DDE-1 domain-containing protein n=1 Tax=Dryococelus australis TaxID=614101 RepID=A0ABQ9H5I2_9NEOP|nr:hypothetical protein PR048_020146 [Dryococelus australis]
MYLGTLHIDTIGDVTTYIRVVPRILGCSKSGNMRLTPAREVMEAAVNDVLANKLTIRAYANKYGIAKSAIARNVIQYSDQNNYSLEYNPRTTISEFFKNYQDIIDKHKFQLHQIWNVDETGLTTVQVQPKVSAEKGLERGQNVTMTSRNKGIGTGILPLFVFLGVNFKQYMLKGARVGSVGIANISGWSNEDIFFEYFDPFLAHANPSLAEKHLLILDKHEYHISVRLIKRVREKVWRSCYYHTTPYQSQVAAS